MADLDDNRSKGTCTRMCSEAEMKIRQREGLLHVLEVMPAKEKTKRPKADRKKVVKMFERSAAGKKDWLQSELRTESALISTTRYLLSLMDSTDFNELLVYDFIFDRIRSVRQELTIQKISRSASIFILESAIRFYLTYSYRLCNRVNFESFLNKKHLSECITELMWCYDEEPSQRCESSNKSLKDSEGEEALDKQPIFESIFLLFYLQVPMYDRYLRLKNLFLRNNDLMKKVLEIREAHLLHNFKRFFKLVKTLPFLLQYAAHVNFPLIYRRAMQVFASGYNSTQFTYPLRNLMRVLGLDSEEQAKNLVAHYGFSIVNHEVRFEKKSFSSSVNIHPAFQLEWIVSDDNT